MCQRCATDASCQGHGAERFCECKPGFSGDGERCVRVATALDRLRWEMPCEPKEHKDTCSPADPNPRASFVLGGDPAVVYQLTLQFRGVVEQESYAGGQADDFWYTGGKPDNGSYNVYRVEISDPPQTYFINAGKAGIRRTFAIDYVRTVRAKGGAKLDLAADAQDGRLIANFDDKGVPIVVPEIPPAPKAFDGQFVQVDVVSVVAGESSRFVLSGEVLFETDQAQLRPRAAEALDALAAKLAALDGRVVVEGHTDAQGTAAHNRELSLRRARAVVEHLAAKGMTRKRLVARGRGATLPVASNDTAEGRARNRRVEIEVRQAK
ncbi:MAG: OmpA family protein [Myxococcales bacterium]|nr:OmpA family protein [Myxococcales bacterium]